MCHTDVDTWQIFRVWIWKQWWQRGQRQWCFDWENIRREREVHQMYESQRRRAGTIRGRAEQTEPHRPSRTRVCRASFGVMDRMTSRSSPHQCLPSPSIQLVWLLPTLIFLGFPGCEGHLEKTNLHEDTRLSSKCPSCLEAGSSHLEASPEVCLQHGFLHFAHFQITPAHSLH